MRFKPGTNPEAMMTRTEIDRDELWVAVRKLSDNGLEIPGW